MELLKKNKYNNCDLLNYKVNLMQRLKRLNKQDQESTNLMLSNIDKEPITKRDFLIREITEKVRER